MKKRLALIVVGCACMATLPAATASAEVKSNLCEHECKGGKGVWGAFEHAKHTSEVETKQSPSTVEWCHLVENGVEQWRCRGYTANWKWIIGLTAYGYTTEYEEAYY